MSYYLWEMRPYFRQVAGQLVLGSITGFIMNTAVVLPAILLGWAIDAVRAFEQGEVGPGAVGWAALAFVGGTLLTEVPRIAKRWWLMTANGRIRANIRADALRGVIAWPMARLDRTPVGEVMARIIGDVEVLGVGLREFTIETWDTVLFSLSLVVAMMVYDLPLTVLALLPVPVAMLLAKATGRWVADRTTASRQANASLTTALQEQLAGIRVLRLFGRTGAAVERVDTLAEEQATTNLALVRLRSGLRPVYTTLMSAGVLLVVWQGGEKVVSGAMTLGAFIAYLELYLRFVNRGFRVPQMINSIQGGAAAYARLRPLLAPPPPLSSEPPWASFRAGHIVGMQESVPERPTVPTGPVAVSLHGVTFRYSTATAPALHDIWLDIPAGALVAITDRSHRALPGHTVLGHRSVLGLERSPISGYFDWSPQPTQIAGSVCGPPFEVRCSVRLPAERSVALGQVAAANWTPWRLAIRLIRGLHQLDGFTPELRRVLRRTRHTGLLPLASRQNRCPPKRVKVSYDRGGGGPAGSDVSRSGELHDIALRAGVQCVV